MWQTQVFGIFFAQRNPRKIPGGELCISMKNMDRSTDFRVTLLRSSLLSFFSSLFFCWNEICSSHPSTRLWISYYSMTLRESHRRGEFLRLGAVVRNTREGWKTSVFYGEEGTWYSRQLKGPGLSVLFYLCISWILPLICITNGPII